MVASPSHPNGGSLHRQSLDRHRDHPSDIVQHPVGSRPGGGLAPGDLEPSLGPAQDVQSADRSGYRVHRSDRGGSRGLSDSFRLPAGIRLAPEGTRDSCQRQFPGGGPELDLPVHRSSGSDRDCSGSDPRPSPRPSPSALHPSPSGLRASPSTLRASPSTPPVRPGPHTCPAAVPCALANFGASHLNFNITDPAVGPHLASAEQPRRHPPTSNHQLPQHSRIAHASPHLQPL